MLVFIDESGHPRPTDDTKRPVLLAACIRETDIRELNTKIHKAKIGIFGDANLEVKATKLIKARSLLPKCIKNKEFADKLVSIIDESNVHFFAVIMERPDFVPYVKEGFLPRQYFYMMKRIELFCQNHKHLMASVIFDEQNRLEDKKLSIAFNNFLYQSALGKTFSKILEIPLFANSEINPGVQIADLAAGIVRHYYEHELYEKKPSSEFEKWLERLFNTISRKTEDLIDKTDKHYKEYGFFIMSKSTFPKSPDEDTDE